MSYCPEDGTEMEMRCSCGIDVCYQCDDCNNHWLYVEGHYYVDNLEWCSVCGDCEECGARGGTPYRQADEGELVVWGEGAVFARDVD